MFDDDSTHTHTSTHTSTFNVFSGWFRDSGTFGLNSAENETTLLMIRTKVYESGFLH